MIRLLAAAAALFLVSGTAQAHPGGAAHDLLHGFLHPIGGLDHVLAMVAVGVLAAQLGGRALWLVPAAFIAMMTMGAAAGMAGLGLPGVELGVAASVVVLGSAIALSLGLPMGVAAALAGVFAQFHGVAHGLEMPPTVAGLGYAAGFVAATAVLHMIGIGAALITARLDGAFGRLAMRSAGALTATAGLVLVLASL